MSTSRSGPGRAVVLISGEGTNLQAFIDRIAAGELAMDIAAVISNREEARGLARASAAGIRTIALPAAGHRARQAYDAELAAHIDELDPDCLLLAGFMRILSPDFVRRYHGRALNVHPSLLPSYRGLDTHRRVLEAGEAQHGSTVHFVTEELDGGPPVIQARLRVREDDDIASLSARVQAAEHIIFPRAAGWLASGRLVLQPDGVYLDRQRLAEPIVIDMEAL